MEEFSFSDSLNREADRRIMVLLLFNYVMAFFFFLFILQVKLTTAIAYTMVVVFLSGLTFLVHRAKYRSMVFHRKLILDDERIIEKNKNKQKCISWGDISKVAVLKNRMGKVVNIRISGSSGKSLFLFCFDNMDRVLSAIKQKIPNKDQVHTRQHVLNWNRPLVFLSFSFAVTAVIYVVATIIVKLLTHL